MRNNRVCSSPWTPAKETRVLDLISVDFIFSVFLSNLSTHSFNAPHTARAALCHGLMYLPSGATAAVARSPQHHSLPRLFLGQQRACDRVRMVSLRPKRYSAASRLSREIEFDEHMLTCQLRNLSASLSFRNRCPAMARPLLIYPLPSLLDAFDCLFCTGRPREI